MSAHFSALLALTIFVLPNLRANAQGIQEVCRDHQSFLKRAMDVRRPVESIMSAASASDLVFLGESHFEFQRDHGYRYLLQLLVKNDARFNCVFLEDEGDGAEAGIKLEQCNRDRSVLNPSLFSADHDRACSSASTSWNSLQNEAFRMGLKVFAIDAYDQCKRFATPTDVDNCRDAEMQRNIQRRMDSGECAKAFAVNGAPHVTSIFSGHQPLGQRTFTAATGRHLAVYRINFTFSTYEPSENTYDPRWRWLDWIKVTDGPERRYLCRDEDQPPSTSGTFGFFHRDLEVKSHPYLWVNGKPAGDWMDFDATIVVGS